MSSIASISSSGPLPNVPQPAIRAHVSPEKPEAAVVPVPTAVVCEDKTSLGSGQVALARVATTPLWSMDFELPRPPAPPASSQRAWTWEETPSIAAGDAGNAASAPRSGKSRDVGAPQAMGGAPQPDAEMNLWELVTWPMRTITEGLVQGGKAVVGAWQDLGQAVGTGAKELVGAIGDAASNAWKALTSIRLW